MGEIWCTGVASKVVTPREGQERQQRDLARVQAGRSSGRRCREQRGDVGIARARGVGGGDYRGVAYAEVSVGERGRRVA